MIALFPSQVKDQPRDSFSGLSPFFLCFLFIKVISIYFPARSETIPPQRYAVPVFHHNGLLCHLFDFVHIEQITSVTVQKAVVRIRFDEFHGAIQGDFFIFCHQYGLSQILFHIKDLAQIDPACQFFRFNGHIFPFHNCFPP